MFKEPPLVKKKLLNSILDQMPEAALLHKWSEEGVVKHFAYLLPEAQRFTEADAEVVLCKTNTKKEKGIEEVLSQLIRVKGVLAGEVVSCGGFFPIIPRDFAYAYFMPKSVRVAYELQIQKTLEGREPEQRSVSERLRGLLDKLTDPNQRIFLEETLKCLAADANRAAIVMGWNLAFDHLRRWIFRRELNAFNNELTARLEKRSKFFDPVVDYQDFPNSEWIVLDICEKAGIIGGHERDVLQEGLKKRNRYAHPSPAVATPAIAAGHIEDLLEHVVLNDRFA